MILLSLIKWRFDFHFFFKHSACRREDFAKVTEITSTLSSHLEKHCTSRWISLVKILVKLVEQIDNLKLYFLNTLAILPSQDSVEREREESLPLPGVNKLENYLTDKRVLLLVCFMVSVAQNFQSLMKPLKNQKPMIHVLHLTCMDLIHLLLQRFIENDKVMRSKKPTKRIGANKLVDLNIDDVPNHKVNQIYKSVFFLEINLLQVR